MTSVPCTPSPPSFSQRLLGACLWAVVGSLARLPFAFYAPATRMLYLARRAFARKNLKVLQGNITQIWGLPVRSSFAGLFATQVMHNQIVTALETLKVIFFPAALKVEGFEQLKALMHEQEQHGRGQLVITAHLGSWELVGQLCAQAGREPFYALAKPSRAPLATLMLMRLRQKTGARLLWTGGSKFARQMLAALQQGAWLGFVMDQKPVGRQGPLVNFFGQPTAFVGGPAQMAIRAQRPVLAVFCVRLGRLHYRLISSCLLAVDHGQADPQVVTQAMAAEIERVVRLYPEQWCWDYKCWRF